MNKLFSDDSVQNMLMQIYKLKKEEYNAAENTIKSCSSTQSHEPLKLSIWALEWNNKLSL